MNLNTKTRYATRAMADLALRHGSGPTSGREIAERQGISQKYLEALLSRLRAVGLVRSTRGAGGGYTLARPPDQIDLAEIYLVFEGSDGFAQCTTDPGVCNRVETCLTKQVWEKMYASCMEILGSTSLADLIQDGEGWAASYCI